MRPDILATGDHFVHQALLYRSDEQFLAAVVPFLEDGARAGEITLVGLGPRTDRLLRGSGIDTSALRFLDDRGVDHRPASVIRHHRDLFDRLTAQGAARIRVLAEVPHTGVGVPWDQWARYEATLNHAFAPFPLWGLCPYDTRLTPDPVLRDVLRTHPFLHGDDGRHLANEQFVDPERFLAGRATVHDALPVEASPPAVDLTDPSPAAARRAVRDVSLSTALPAGEVDDLVTAVSEAVTNALTHGVPPVRLRMWPGPHRVVASVGDRGPGPTDPYAGLLPTTDTSTGGLGLWVIHQICGQVTLERRADGFTLRIVAGRPDGARST